MILAAILVAGIATEASLLYLAIGNTEENFHENFVIMAHRGDTDDAPENTIPAFDAAIAAGADYAELDVQLTSDRVVVVTHDTNLKNTAGRNVNIYDLTLEEARRLDVGSSYSAKFAGTPIPTLAEVIERCRGKILLNIEIKTNERDTHFEPEVIAVIREHGFERDCVITSLSEAVIREVKRLAPELAVGLILTVGAGNFHDANDVDFYSVESLFITPEMLEKCRARNRRVYAWTIDTPVGMKEMIHMKVDGIITGHTATALAILADQTSLAGRIRYQIFGF